MHLGDYLTLAGKRRHQIGIWDCCIFPSDWAVLNGWPDPMASWRGTYASENAADARGGMEEAFAAGMEQAGLSLTVEPMPGDIGLIDLIGTKAGAIWTGRRWAFVAQRGLGVASIEPQFIIASWSIERG
jgi:hypothetical protein